MVVCYRTQRLDLTWVPRRVPIVVVTNDSSRPVVTPDDRSIQWLDPGENIGFGAAVNRAVELLGDEVERLVVVNPDCHLRPAHWEVLAAGPADAVLTIPLASEHGRPTTVASPYPSPTRHLLTAWRVRERLRRFIPLSHSSATAIRPGECRALTTHWVSGAVISLDRRRFEEVGGFDESYFLYYEDVDLCRRLSDRFPKMRACVADVSPGVHEVGSSGRGDARVAKHRAHAARRYAIGQQGGAWAVVRRLLPRGSAMHRPSDRADVVVIRLGRRGLGEERRAESWSRLAEAERLSVRQLALAGRLPTPAGALKTLRLIVRGEVVPEALSWDVRSVLDELERSAPSFVVPLTARAYTPEITEGPWRVVLDLVDPLSKNYGDRRDILGRWTFRGMAYGLLAAAHRRFEARPHPAALITAAGRADAEQHGVRFLPNVVAELPSKPKSGTGANAADLVFVGSLSYAPNIEALDELERITDQLRASFPNLSVRLAGARPPHQVRRQVTRLGWDLWADFEDEAAVYAAARVAIVPIVRATGIQNKVIDAMRHGVPVVTYPTVAAGLPSGAPLVVAEDAAGAAAAIASLLHDANKRMVLGQQSTRWVKRELAPDAWSQILRER